MNVWSLNASPPTSTVRHTSPITGISSPDTPLPNRRLLFLSPIRSSSVSSSFLINDHCEPVSNDATASLPSSYFIGTYGVELIPSEQITLIFRSSSLLFFVFESGDKTRNSTFARCQGFTSAAATGDSLLSNSIVLPVGANSENPFDLDMTCRMMQICLLVVSSWDSRSFSWCNAANPPCAFYYNKSTIYSLRGYPMPRKTHSSMMSCPQI